MNNLTRFPSHDDLFSRETIEVELPRFLVRVFEEEVAKANAAASKRDRITLNDYIEYHLAEFLSIADVATLEQECPGLGMAVWQWLEQMNN
jgi:hypothetical protein